MNRRLLVQAAIPSMIIGLVLSASCLASAWYINRLQASMADILSDNVTSLRAAQGLEISLHQLRFRCYIYLIAPGTPPDQALLQRIERSEQNFVEWLRRAKESANTNEEWVQIRAIERGFEQYQKAFDQAQKEVELHGPLQNFRKLADRNPVDTILEPCHELFRVNEQLMTSTAQENARLSSKLHLGFFFLGLGGPVSGLILGLGLARGWSRSIHRLSVQVQGIAQRLDQDVATVSVVSSGDFDHLDQQLQHVVGRVEEVVEHLQTQQREMIRTQQMTAVGQLAASVAHEVRNPLTSIKLLVEAALRSRKARPFTEENLRVVHGEVVRLEKTVQSFLNFARPPVLHRQFADLRELVHRAVELVRARARQQNVALEVTTPATAVHHEVDADQLCTVLVNLFINALDAMPRGGQLDIVLEASPEGGTSLRIHDSGPGIAPEIADRLFTPFASTKPTGTGLGLSISRRIVEDHGGRLIYEPGRHQGASFRITLSQHLEAKPCQPCS